MLKKIAGLLTDYRGLHRLLNGIIFFFRIIPAAVVKLLHSRNKICICFDYKEGSYADFYINIYLKLKEKTGYETILLSKSVTPEWNEDQRFDFKDFVPEIFYKFLSKKIVIHAAALRPLYLTPEKKTRHIQMNHGFGSFISVLDETFLTNVDMFFANTEHQLNQLKEGKYSNYILNKFIKRIGYPKIDGFVDENTVKPSKKEVNSIFYGPTYHIKISSIFVFLEPLIKYCTERKIKLFIKLHPFLRRKFDYEMSGGIDWEKKIKSISQNNTFVEWVPPCELFTEVVKYFDKSDIFMTDNSGFGYEFVLITGKPIIYLGDKLKIPLDDSIQNSNKRYNECPEIFYRKKIGPVIENIDNFETKMDRIFQQDLNNYTEEIKKFRQNFTFHLGEASKYAVSAIDELATDISLND